MNVPTASYNPSPFFAFAKKKVALGQVDPTGEGGWDYGPASGGTQPASGGGIWDWIGKTALSWSQTGQKILLAQNVPTTYTRTGPGGTIQYTQQGGQVPIFGASDVSGQLSGQASSGTGMILVAGAALLLVVMLARK
jgi:hypothetical protein